MSSCTVHNCEKEATRTLQWPEPGELEAEFCDEHAEQKLSLTHVTEIANTSDTEAR